MILVSRSHRFLKFLICYLAVSLAFADSALRAAESETALPFVSPLFADGMVLQRDRPNPVWGWAEPGQVVRVTLAGKTATATAATDGKWVAHIIPPAAGGPYELILEGAQKLILRDVLVGDVWLCSGQSNMAFALRGARDGPAEARGADSPQIRLFAVSSRPAYAPTATPRGRWQVCTPETAGEFSAVAYYFARRVQQELNIPIGLIQAAVGGSPAESWMSAQAAAGTNEFPAQLAEIARLRSEQAPEIGSFLMHWLARYDHGDKDSAWAQASFDDRDWPRAELTDAFAALGVPETPAVVWFRREIDLPDPLPAGPARLQLGQVEKMDTAFVNGRWVGSSSWVENPRNYAIPAGLLKPGRNVIALRVLKLKPVGGFLDGSPAVRLQFGSPESGTTFPLGDSWRVRLSVDARAPHPLPLDLENYPTMPTVLYNGMTAPLEPFALTGALWYQGEANFTRAVQYRKLLPALIADWRQAFNAPALPFYVVSLPAFMARREVPGTSDGWTELREAQSATVGAVPNTGLVVTLDVGDAADIHPTNKRPVGERLAALALANHYGRTLPAQGPTLRNLERAPGALRLHFTHTDGGLTSRGDPLGEFSVAGTDRVWHWADARIEGDSVIVSSPEAPQPVAVRYAWQANPRATLFNGAGLPAAPFRTDDWPTAQK